MENDNPHSRKKKELPDLFNQPMIPLANQLLTLEEFKEPVKSL